MEPQGPGVSSDLSENSSSPATGRWMLHSSNHVTADTKASPCVWHCQNRAQNCWETRNLYWRPVSLAARLSQYWMDPLQPSTWIGGGKRCSWIKRHEDQAALFPQVDNYCSNQRLEEAQLCKICQSRSQWCKRVKPWLVWCQELAPGSNAFLSGLWGCLWCV